MVNVSKETLDKWINVENVSYLEIGRRLGCSVTYVKKYAKKLGIQLPCRRYMKSNPWNKGNREIYVCRNCGKKIISTKHVHRSFCNAKCFNEYRTRIKYEHYLSNQSSFKGHEINYQWLKPIILKEQNNKCSLCGIGTIWNKKELHFVLDHIDGDATNNTRANLRLICPNCDSQLDTYKSRNIGRSTRKYKPYHLKSC